MKVGKVYLVGAGIGSSQMISAKGLAHIKSADVIVYDRLVNPELLKYAPYQTRFIDVGKLPKYHKVNQEEIEKLLIDYGKQGYKVVRLKAGDPYVFGRGAEEGEHLSRAGIDWEVIPGITSSIAGAGYGGIPVSHRDKASSFHIITGHRKEDAKELEWEAISRLEGTLIFLMGVGQLPYIVERLLSYGKEKATPVGIVEWAGYPWQKSIEATLETIERCANEKQIQAPAIIVVGEVVSLRKNLNIFERMPLFGKVFGLVTRPLYKNKDSRILREIEACGGQICMFSLPDYEKQDLERDILEKIDGIFLEAEEVLELGVEGFLRLGLSYRQLMEYEWVGASSRIEKKMGQLHLPRDRYDSTKKYLKLGFRQKSSYPNISGTYYQIARKIEVPQEMSIGKVDGMIFPSSSLAMEYQSQYPLLDVPAFVLGKETKKALLEFGWKEICESKEKTITSLVECIKEYEHVSNHVRFEE